MKRSGQLGQEEPDDGSEPEGTQKSKGKGKAKATNARSELTGNDRCETCRMKDKPCIVDLVAITKWEEDVAAGKEFGRTPGGVACEECRSRKGGCNLPRTMEMRGIKPEKGEKRKVDDEVVEVVALGPHPKKRRIIVSNDPIPPWIPRFVGFVQGLDVQMEMLLRQKTRSRAAQERIADALENIAERIEQDGLYSPGTESPGDSAEDEDGEFEVAEELRTRGEEDLMEEDK